MKKTLIALAAVAVSGAAMAQSSVTLYGIADVAVVKSKDSSAALASGGVSGSRWGIKGSEDLGGGLKANFTFEQGVDLTNGAASGFNRQAFVGLSGGFGEVRAGRVYTAYHAIATGYSTIFDSSLTTNKIADSYNYQTRLDQGLYYVTPSFGGVTAAVSTQFKQGDANKRATAFNVAYNGGPLSAALAYEQQKDDLGLDRKQTLVAAAYDFGVAKLVGSIGQNKDVSDDVTVGVYVPVGSALTLSAGVTQVRPEVGENGLGYGLGAAYSLSKRTTLYTAFNKFDDEARAFREVAENTFAVGIKHTF